VDFCVEIKYGAQKKDRMRGIFGKNCAVRAKVHKKSGQIPRIFVLFPLYK